MRPFMFLFGLALSIAAGAQGLFCDWAVGCGDSRQDRGVAVAVGPDGSVFHLGTYQSDSIVLGDTTFYGWLDDYIRMFLAKYTPDGTLLWAIEPTGSYYQCMPEAVHVDQEGHIYIAGGFQGDGMDFGDAHIQGGNVGSDTQLFIVELDEDGNGIWGYGQGGTMATNPDFLTNVTTDSQGNVIVLGTTYSSAINLGGTTYETYGPNMLLLVKFSTNGQILAVATSSSQCSHSAMTLQADQAGNVLIGGWFFNTPMRFGFTEVEAVGVNDTHGFMFKFDQDLVPLWGKTIGGAGDDRVGGIALDADGGIHLAGTCQSAVVTTEGLSATNAFNRATMLAKYDPEGIPQWLRITGDSVWGGDLAVDDAGRTHVMANLMQQTPLAFGGDEIMADGEYNIALLTFGPDGTPVNATAVHGPWVSGFGISSAPGDVLYITGYFSDGPAWFDDIVVEHDGGGGIYNADAFLAKYHVPGNALGQDDDPIEVPQIFPLPATDRVFLRTEGSSMSGARIMDQAGRVVRQSPLQGSSCEIDLQGLAPAAYVLRVETTFGVRTFALPVIR